jgi:hypothetical protein
MAHLVDSLRCEGSDAIGGIADLSERLVQTNSVENDPLRR